MSVLIEVLNVIVRRATLDVKYPGGVIGYERDRPNRTYCTDDHLTKVGFMAQEDVKKFVTHLEGFGLVHLTDNLCVDIVVVDQLRGPTAPCPWLEGGIIADGYGAVWLRGEEPGAIAVPRGWTPPRPGEMVCIPEAEIEGRLFPLTREGAVDVVLDLKNTRELYRGRPFPREHLGEA
jgi:hypothetical protein